MKDLNDYINETRVLLGDPAGRRYSDEQISFGLRLALSTAKRFRPAKTTVRIRVEKVSGEEAVMAWAPETDREIMTIRNEAGEWLDAGDYRTDGKLYLRFYQGEKVPAEGTELTIELSEDYRIRGLSGASQTTVPDSMMLTVCTGAAANAMRIRARSVTEVFGKRPEDTENLLKEADRLQQTFIEELENDVRQEFFHSNPWEGKGFPI